MIKILRGCLKCVIQYFAIKKRYGFVVRSVFLWQNVVEILNLDDVNRSIFIKNDTQYRHFESKYGLLIQAIR